MIWKMLIIMVAFLMPYLSRLPGVFTRDATWFWSYLPSWGGFAFLSIFNALAVVPLLVLALVGDNSRVGYAFLITAAVHGLATFWFNYNYDLAADAQAGIALIVFPLAVLGITTVVGLVTFFGERMIKQ